MRYEVNFRVIHVLEGNSSLRGSILHLRNDMAVLLGRLNGRLARLDPYFMSILSVFDVIEVIWTPQNTYLINKMVSNSRGTRTGVVGRAV